MNQDNLYSPEQDLAFHKAVKYAETVLEIMINKYRRDKELEKKTKTIAYENKGKDIVILDKFYPTNPFKKEGIKFIVYQDFDRWNCNSTDISNYKVSESANNELIYRHETGSFASFKTKLAAIKAAEISL